MIYFLSTRRHDYTVRWYLEDVGKAFASEITPISYLNLHRCWDWKRGQWHSGTYLFTDIERLPKMMRTLAGRFHQGLERSGNRVLNDPSSTLDRFGLLTRLNSLGINEFAVHRLTDELSKIRYPAFARCADDHRGKLSEPVADADSMRRCLNELKRTKAGRRANIIIEHVDVGDARGIYRKYSAMRVGDAIIPRHLFFADQWHVKAWQRMEPELLAEEQRYIHTNPHEAELRRIFDIADIQFGRIDYGMHNGKIQVWEINTNPVLPVRFGDGGDARRPVNDFFEPRFAVALGSLARETRVCEIPAPQAA